MKKRVCSRIFLPVVLTAMLLVFASGCGNVQKTESQAKQAPQKQDHVQVTTKEEKFNETNLSVVLKIPVISEMNRTETQSQLNTKFESTALERKKTISEENKSFVEESAKNGYPLREYQLQSDYNVSYNRNGILSLTSQFYQFTGGAHGMTYRETYNIDINTGQEITLRDLFKEGIDYKEIINQEIKKQIHADPGNYFPDGFTTISDNQTFYFHEGGIAVYFELYEIAPYASGFPEFKIPFSMLGDSVKAEFLKIWDGN